MSARALLLRRRMRVCLVAILAVGAVGHAEEAGEQPPGARAAAGQAAPPPAPVALERLLKLPDSVEYSVPRRGGATRNEWRARFASLREELAGERQELEEAQAELQELAGTVDAWQVGPAIPGADVSGDGPLDYRLQQEIREHREEIQRLERDLRDLEVEANLASVPADWRE